MVRNHLVVWLERRHGLEPEGVLALAFDGTFGSVC